MRASRRIAAFVRLSRLKFLSGGVLAFALGAAVARFDGARLTLGAYLAGQVTVSAFHLMVHYANDYFDRLCDAECERTPWSGGSGALLDGVLSPRVALIAALACAVVGTIGVAAFALTGNGRVAATCLCAGVLAWSYSAPPIRLLARGWGELDTAIIIAMLFPLAGYWTFADGSPLRVVSSALPSAAAMLVLMFCVEFPDVESDRRTGKLNLIARFGRERGRFLTAAAVAAIYAAGFVAMAFGAVNYLGYFLALTVPLAWGLYAALGRDTDADIAARGVAMFVVTILGSVLAYLS